MQRLALPLLVSVFSMSVQGASLDSAIEHSDLSSLNLSPEEIERYRSKSEEIQGLTVDNLNPLELLGITSSDPAEKRRYAREFVRLKLEHTRSSIEWSLLVQEETEKLSAESYLMASDLIAESMAKEGYRLKGEREKYFGLEKSGEDNGYSHSDAFSEMYTSYVGERAILFVEDSCQPCERDYQRLLKDHKQGKNSGIDVVFAGMEAADRDLITRWAVKAGLDPNGDLMRKRKVTLNYEGKRWAKIRRGRPVPLVVDGDGDG